ncbi:formylmethanofuran dehydrogenase, subunit C [Methanocella conradii HZ254]|uniref:formylmethanofuran dehydrogenase n=1 Tax=Methanocella conradii (strain DSM 24694 / JCM 17849 / CGMCC 1.5162 / HZ254) TaxID=1041930 RepID=H8I7I3_METCZ|nr:formylmethanofuran dehydrogenase subunit C [Methanocella conradii]AFD01193.1 formylmethanofuran dehydrogenase, subunit C [Methanocella conradii HZ254]MDI6896965.1 formylmethanofuran dehydrogenase subunit C [Methanocella conradii]
MEKITLTPNGEKYLVLEAEVISPDVFAGKTLDEIKALKVWEGNTTWPLGKFFDISGTVAARAEDQAIVINGSVPRVKYIGAKMTAGAILCKGDVDMYCGAWMKGGSIIVKGNADAFAGIQMEGGKLVIEGNAGNYLGASYRGDWRGMKGGEIVVNGNAGCDIGEYMMGGTITVKGNVDINAGIHAGRALGPKDPGGKIVIYGDSPGRVGAQMIRGTIYVLGKIETMMPGFALKTTQEVEFDGKATPFKVYQGDRAEAGKGTLYVKA